MVQFHVGNQVESTYEASSLKHRRSSCSGSRQTGKVQPRHYARRPRTAFQN